MPANPLVDANCEIILRDANLEDAGEITRFIQWQCDLKLNDISSWQLDVQTQHYRGYGIDETMGILFYRDNKLILSGPVMKVRTSVVAGQEKTTIVGGSDEAFLQTRICYPVVTGPIWDTTIPIAGAGLDQTGGDNPPPAQGAWRFAVKRSAIGITTSTIKDAEFSTDANNDASQTGPANLPVLNATGFQAGNKCNVINLNGAIHPRNILGVDLSQNVITVDSGDSVPWLAGCTVYQTSGGIVDDPAFVGYDTRTGYAENVAKDLVFLNAGPGACVDNLGPRPIPFLVCAPSNGRGMTVTANSRGQLLLNQIQNICASGGVNFSVRQQDQQLVFDCWYGNDLAKNNVLVFSMGGGNLKEYDVTFGPPTANFVMGAGPETGTSKLMLPTGDVTSISQYGRRESWVLSGTAQAGDTPTQIMANMVQANNLSLAQSLVNSSITLSMQENDQVRFPRDFNLGDKVSIEIGGAVTDQTVTLIKYSIPAGTGSASGSAIAATLPKTATRAMYEQNNISKLLQQMAMN